MKSVFTSALIACLLVAFQSAQAAVVRSFHGSSSEAQELKEALSMVNATYNCVDSRDPKTRQFSLKNFTGAGVDDMGGPNLGENYKLSVAIHDGSSPLIEFAYELNGDDSYRQSRQLPQAQTFLYTNNELTSVTRVLRRVYNYKRSNKGTLAKPNFVNESVLKYTIDCRLGK